MFLNFQRQCCNLLVLQAMFRWNITMNEWCWFKDTHFIFISCSNFTRISATVEGRYSDVIVSGSRDNLDSLKCACQYYNITSCCIGLQKKCKKDIKKTVSFHAKMQLNVRDIEYGIIRKLHILPILHCIFLVVEIFCNMFFHSAWHKMRNFFT